MIWAREKFVTEGFGEAKSSWRGENPLIFLSVSLFWISRCAIPLDNRK
jgi:hypothetical protein